VELLPYRTLIDAGLADSVMTAHVFNRRLDDRRPATLSRATISGLLRGELGFAGPVVSDDLRMAAIEQQYGLGEAAVLASTRASTCCHRGRRLPTAARLPGTLGAIRDALAIGTLDPPRRGRRSAHQRLPRAPSLTARRAARLLARP
jgi:beta-N-acetylhexosaminidase